MPEGQVLEFTHVTKRFGAVTAVSDLSARVEPGVVTAFLGPNGAGKTTTLRILLGQTRASSGTATIGGTPYAELRQPLRVIGSVLEETPYRPRRTAARHLSIAAKANGIPLSRIDEVLSIVGLHGEAETRIGGYSLGMRQRLSVATALLGDPGALVFDEPANGLDPEGIRWMRLLMRRLADEGRTVLVSSHVLSEVEQVADHVLVLSKGELVLSSGIETLADPSAGSVVVDADDRTALTAALSAAGLDVEILRGGLTVRGSDAGQVGAIAASAGIALSTLQQRGPTLEDVFIELVRGGSLAPRAEAAATQLVAPVPTPDDAAAEVESGLADSDSATAGDSGASAAADDSGDADDALAESGTPDDAVPAPAEPEALAAVAASVESGAAGVGAPSFDDILFGAAKDADADADAVSLAELGLEGDEPLDDGAESDPVADGEQLDDDATHALPVVVPTAADEAEEASPVHSSEGGATDAASEAPSDAPEPEAAPVVPSDGAAESASPDITGDASPEDETGAADDETSLGEDAATEPAQTDDATPVEPGPDASSDDASSEEETSDVGASDDAHSGIEIFDALDEDESDHDDDSATSDAADGEHSADAQEAAPSTDDEASAEQSGGDASDDPRSAAVSSMLAAAARAYFDDEPKDYPVGHDGSDGSSDASSDTREPWVVASTGVIDTVPGSGDAEDSSVAGDDQREDTSPDPDDHPHQD